MDFLKRLNLQPEIMHVSGQNLCIYFQEMGQFLVYRYWLLNISPLPRHQLTPPRADPDLNMCAAIPFPRIKQKIFKLGNPFQSSYACSTVLSGPTSAFTFSHHGKEFCKTEQCYIANGKQTRLRGKTTSYTFPQPCFWLLLKEVINKDQGKE